MRPGRRAIAQIALAVVLGLALGAVSGAAAPAASAAQAAPREADEGDGVPITVRVPDGGAVSEGEIVDAQLRWGLSREAGSGAFAGGCNFLSAGAAGDSGSARVWAADDGLYASESGAVRIERVGGDGGWRSADFSSRCLDRAGAPLSASSLTASSESQVVIDGGVGRLGDDGLIIRWTGSFTVAFYGGMTYWSATDPTLSVSADGTGRLVATLSGYGTSMDDLTEWRPLPAREVVLAELRGVDLHAAGGFAVQPEYLGVSSGISGQAARTSANEAYWGSFPPSFVDYQTLTGQGGYWFTSGGLRDAAKPATAIVVNYDAAAPAVTPPVPARPAAGTDPSNPAVARPGGAATASGVGGATAGAAGEPAGAIVPAAASMTGGRETAGLIPDAVAGSNGLLLPLGGLLLALLVSTLCVLHLAGRLPMPRSAGSRPAVARQKWHG